MNVVIELGKNKYAKLLIEFDVLYSIDDFISIFSAPIFLFGMLVFASNNKIMTYKKHCRFSTWQKDLTYTLVF